jgi:hypothetical protein
VCKRPPLQARISVTHYSRARRSSLSPFWSFRTLRQRYVPRPARSTPSHIKRIARVTCTEDQPTAHRRSRFGIDRLIVILCRERARIRPILRATPYARRETSRPL